MLNGNRRTNYNNAYGGNEVTDSCHVTGRQMTNSEGNEDTTGRREIVNVNNRYSNRCK